TFRVEDPTLAVTRTDFAISPRSGAWRSAPLETLGGLLSELAQQPAVQLIGGMDLERALAHGIGPIRATVGAALATDPRLPVHGRNDWLQGATRAAAKGGVGHAEEDNAGALREAYSPVGREPLLALEVKAVAASLARVENLPVGPVRLPAGVGRFGGGAGS